MNNDGNFRLCGGTFFTLLLEARKPLMSANGHYAGKKDGLTEYETLIALARVINSDLPSPMEPEKKTIQGNASEFKKCENAGGGYFPFGDQTALDAFNQKVKNDYESVLQRMVSFVDDYLEVDDDTKKDEALVQALIELIERDTEIADNQLFYVNSDGTTMTKGEILKAETFCYQSFLLGLYHYAVVVVRDNTVGGDTFNALCPPAKGSRRSYTGTLGRNRSTSLSLIYKTKTARLEEDKIEIIEPEQKEQSYEEGREEKKQMDTSPMFCLNVTGNGNNFFNHVDTVNNYYGGKKDGE